MKMHSDGPEGTAGEKPKSQEIDTREAVQGILEDLEAFLEHDDEITLRVNKAGFGMSALKHGGTRHALFLSLVFSRLAFELLQKETAASGSAEIAELAVAVYTAKAASLNFGAARQEKVDSLEAFKAVMKKLNPEA